MANRDELVSLVYKCPVDIALKIGYDKLTPLHNAWIQDMVFGTEDETLQAHRGSYKTTCLSISFAFIIVLFPGLRTMFMRKTDTDVAEVMDATASILQSDYFQSLSEKLYGFPVTIKKSTQGEINTNLRLGVSGASQIIGLGLGGSLTGKHADRIFTDDIINLKDRVSGAERERTKLVYQELQNIRNRGGRIFNTGTPWHKDDAFQLMPNIHRYDCYSTGLMNRDEVQAIRNSMSPSLFAANYDLKHIADTEAMFTNAQFFSDYTRLYEGIGHIDAAYGGEDGTAFTAIMKRDDLYYVYVRLWQKSIDKCLNEIISLAKQLRIGTIYCEKNADKGYLKRDIIKKGHPAKSYSEHMNKFIKISTYLKSAWGNIRFLDCDEFPLDSEALNQILDYNENATHDDAPDSLASAVRKFAKQPKVKGYKEGV